MELMTATKEEVDKAQENLAIARRMLITLLPYIAHIAWKMPIIAMEKWPKNPQGQIAVTDRGVIIANAIWVAKQEAKNLVGDVFHEILHILLGHPSRRGSREHIRWNIAGDMCIEPTVRDAKCAVSYPGTFPALFGLPEGETADFYYAKLEDKIKTVKVCLHGDCGQQGQGQGQQGQGQQGQGSGCQANPGKDKNGVIHIHVCGSGAGQTHDAESQLTQELKAAGFDEKEADILRDQIAKEIKEHSKSRGDIPGGLLRWAEIRLKPTPEELRRELRAVTSREIANIAGRVDYTYSTPSRRRLPRVILPSLRGTMPHISLVIDTSGSVGTDMLNEFASIGAGLAREASVVAFGCDASASEAVQVRRAADVKKALKGGGGTDMGIGIRAALSQRRKPDLIIVLTDGYTPWPERASVPVRTIAVVPYGCEPGPAWMPTYFISIEKQTHAA